jgi:hypothetical protein
LSEWPSNQRMILCGGLQSGGTTLISWCFLQRRDTNGVLDMAHNIVHGGFAKVSEPIFWINMTIGAFRWLDVREHYRDRGWDPEPLLVVRDVRTTYDSLLTKSYGFNGLTAEEPPLRMRFRRFLLDWELFRANAWPIVKFEGVVDDARETLTKACHDLGIAWDEAMLSWPKDASQIAYVLDPPNQTFEQSLDRGAMASSLLKEKARLEVANVPRRELAWLEETFAEYNEFHGYPKKLRPASAAELADELPPPQYRGTERQWLYDEYVRVRSENERLRAEVEGLVPDDGAMR